MSSDEKPESLSGLAADVLVLLAQARESLQWFHGFSHCVEPEKHRFYSQELINFANTLRIIQIKASELQQLAGPAEAAALESETAIIDRFFRDAYKAAFDSEGEVEAVEIIAELRNLAGGYKYLSETYYHEPDTLQRARRRTSFLEKLAHALDELPEPQASMTSDFSRELAREFARIFINAYGRNPMEGVRLAEVISELRNLATSYHAQLANRYTEAEAPQEWRSRVAFLHMLADRLNALPEAQP